MEKIKLGVFGMGTRGRDLARDFLKQGCQLVAMCEARESELKKAVELFGDIILEDDGEKYIFIEEYLFLFS